MRSTTRRLVLAVGVAGTVILTAPFLVVMRNALQDAFPLQFSRLLFGFVGVAAAGAVAVAALRIRDRRPARYGLLAAALTLGAAYARASATGNPEVDAVERIHFVEYGVVTILFFRVWQDLEDAASLLLPALAGLVVATLDELFQWFVPYRVGELRDILLDMTAVLCGLLFSLAVLSPRRLDRAIHRESRRTLAVLGGLALVLVAGFLDAVHLGQAVESPAGRFLSRFDETELRALSSERAARWRRDPPVAVGRLSREDQYLAEGLWHVQRRNQKWDAGDVFGAWRENLILERYYAPVLDTPTHAAPRGARWPDEQRADAAARAAPDEARDYVSDAHPLPLFEWPRAALWTVTAVGVGAMVLAGVRS